MMESVQRVARVVKDEEHRYATTFQVAEKIFHDEAKAAAGGVLPGRGGLQAVRHLRPGARRAGRHGSRARPGDRPRGLRRRDGEAADARARQLEGRGEGAGQSRVYQALPKTEFVGRETLEAPATVVAALDGESRARPHAVLRRGRRPGGRHGRAGFGGDGRDGGGRGIGLPGAPGQDRSQREAARAGEGGR